MGRGGIIAIIVILGALALVVVLSSQDALEGPGTTPPDRFAVPSPEGGSKDVPAERQPSQ